MDVGDGGLIFQAWDAIALAHAQTPSAGTAKAKRCPKLLLEAMTITPEQRSWASMAASASSREGHG
ncbi:hypothetical protein [Streptomyces sp. NPDC097610]|uniref:hypothetical protein n=1 Tax=Streptomyces sp. NPDC097610 TaxID=3157227 RepID=UPI003322E9DA